MFSHITRKEWKLVLLFSGIFSIIFFLPFLYAFFSAPKNLYFTGLHYLAPGDYSLYYSYIHQAYQGHFIFRDLFTTESVSYTTINTFWNFAALLGKFLRIGPIWAFQVSRIAMIPALAFSLYIFFSYFYSDPRERKYMLFFSCFASGIGAYAVSFVFFSQSGIHQSSLPPDLWVAESNIFLSMLHSGHMVLSWALIILIFLFSLLSMEEKKFFWSVIAGALMLFLFSFHPFHFILISAVLAAHALFLWCKDKKFPQKPFQNLCILLFFSLPGVFYYAFLLKSDIVAQARSTQNVGLTPPLLSVALGFGFLLFFGLYGIYYFFRQKGRDQKREFILIWLFVQSLLIYAPVPLQRRLIEGMAVPLMVFAFDALIVFWKYASAKKPLVEYASRPLVRTALGIVFFAIIFFPSNLFVAAIDLSWYYQKNPFIYFSRVDVSPLLWLRAQEGDGAVLADVNVGHFIPGISGRAVFAGHYIETPNFQKKAEQIKDFYSAGLSREERIAFLKTNRIEYVYYGKSERRLGSFNPAGEKYLSKVFEYGSTQIYRVN